MYPKKYSVYSVYYVQIITVYVLIVDYSYFDQNERKIRFMKSKRLWFENIWNEFWKNLYLTKDNIILDLNKKCYVY
mgnify:CR=1 FL=1